MHENFRIPLELFLLGVTAYLLKYGSNIFLSNSLSPLMYGDLSVAIKLLGVSSLLILMGTNSTAMRYFSIYHKENNLSKMSRYISWNFRLLVRSFAVAIAILLLLSLIIFILHSFDLHPLEKHHLSIYSLWIAPLVAMNVLLSSYLLSAKQYVIPSFFLYLAPNLLIFSFFSLGLFFFDIVYTTAHLTLLLLLVFITLVILQSLYFLNKIPFASDVVINTSIKVKQEHESWQKFSIRHYFVNSILLIVASADLLIVELISSDEHIVGHYAACLVIVSVLTTAASMSSKFIKPKVSAFIKDRDDVNFRKLLTQFEFVNISVLSLLAILIIVFRKPLLLNFGADYIDAELPLVILTVGYLFESISKESTTVLSYSGNADVLLRTSMYELTCLVVLCVFSTYFWGLVGATLATTLVLFVRSIYIFWASRIENLYEHSH